MKMKKKYTRKQIMESIKYWQKQLNEGRYREGDVIYRDSAPGNDEDYENSKVKLGQEAAVITVDEWKRSKSHPTEKIEKCTTIQDLKNISKKYGSRGLYVEFNDEFDPDLHMSEVVITPLNPDDGDWWKKAFGSNSTW